MEIYAAKIFQIEFIRENSVNSLILIERCSDIRYYLSGSQGTGNPSWFTKSIDDKDIFSSELNMYNITMFLEEEFV